MSASITAAVVAETARRIILVNGDAAVRGALSFSLELDGFAVQTYPDAERAAAGAFPRSGCLVIDQDLPGMGGLDLVDVLRTRSVDLPAVLIATNPDARTRRRAARAGVAIVEKPILGEALVDGVRAALNPAA